jgi:hypothetical protein
VTFLERVVTTPGSYLFDLRSGDPTYVVSGTFAHGVLEFRFSAGDEGLGGVKAGSVVVTKGPPGASTSACGVAWSLSGNAATVGQDFEVKFTVTADSSQACR